MSLSLKNVARSATLALGFAVGGCADYCDPPEKTDRVVYKTQSDVFASQEREVELTRARVSQLPDGFSNLRDRQYLNGILRKSREDRTALGILRGEVR